MTHIWLDLSVCHPQAYPSRLQTMSSLRKDNVPKRCFPDNNLGQESRITLLSALSQETRPNVLSGSFSRFKQTIYYLPMPAPFQAHPGMPQNCHCLKGIENSKMHICRPLSAPKDPEVLVVWYSYLCELGALS